MSYFQPPIVPLSFSVERLLQRTKRENGSGSIGSPSDIESTPPSSPESCNSTDSQENSHYGPFIIAGNASNFTTFPCPIGIPISSFALNPTTAALAQSAWRLSAATLQQRPTIIPTLPRAAEYAGTSTQQQGLQTRQLYGKRSLERVPHRPKKYQDLERSSDGQPIASAKSITLSPELVHATAPLAGSFLAKDSQQEVKASSSKKSEKWRLNDKQQQQIGDEDLEEKCHQLVSKKKRTTFSSSQLESLEIRFNQQKYLTKHDRSKLAAALGLTEKHIKTWYQNRRTKWKRECSDEVWSKERESAAALMYAQHLQLKSVSSGNDSHDSTKIVE